MGRKHDEGIECFVYDGGEVLPMTFAGGSDKALIQQVMRFVLFSGTAAVVNLAAGYLLYEILGYSAGFLYGMSVAIAFLAGMFVSFLLNRRFTFELAGRRVRDEMRTFLFVSIGGLLLTVGLSTLFRDQLLPWLLNMLLDDPAQRFRVNLEVVSHGAAVQSAIGAGAAAKA